MVSMHHGASPSVQTDTKEEPGDAYHDWLDLLTTDTVDMHRAIVEELKASTRISNAPTRVPIRS
jgi:hypothetical protein